MSEVSFPTVSIVINTFNRVSDLRRLLESLQFLRYPGEFEVIVVNGPSTDDTAALLTSWGDKIKVESCPIANLSVSRNIGICAANGEIVAFLDDDSIPESNWLIELVPPYTDPQVGAVGGRVFDHTGFDFQHRFAIADRLSYANLTVKSELVGLSFPQTLSFPTILGANSSFRRAALLEIGGFDEEFEYFLDETDVCLRLVDSGYMVRQVESAFVHHKYSPSHIRGTNKINVHRYPLIKNRVYFMLKHALNVYGEKRIKDEVEKLKVSQRLEVNYAIKNKQLPKSARSEIEDQIKVALRDAFLRADRAWDTSKYITPAKIASYQSVFRRFEPIVSSKSLRIVLASVDYPDERPGGIATFTRDLAKSLANLGHHVHVVTSTSGVSRIDFEEGVWLHRIEILNQHQTMPVALGLPAYAWNWSASLKVEVENIHSRMSVDIVEAPLWDSEAIAFTADSDFPLVTSLHTPLRSWVKFHGEQLENKEWVQKNFNPLVNSELIVLNSSAGIRANSKAIVQEIENLYGVELPRNKVNVIPHGLSSHAKAPSLVTKDVALVPSKILFVGRLEPRKGIRFLIESALSLLSKNHDLVFSVVGRDVPCLDNEFLGYEKYFKKEFRSFPHWDQITFHGQVTEMELDQHYRDCDIFVVPSLFESFGLVAIEAMRHGKAVVGSACGGLLEIITEDVNGVFCEPGSSTSLAAAIERVIYDRPLLKKLSSGAFESFNLNFRSELMARSSELLYREVLANHIKG